MTGTQCDNCGKFKTLHESMKKHMSLWIKIDIDFYCETHDFCCKDCLLNFLSKHPEIK